MIDSESTLMNVCRFSFLMQKSESKVMGSPSCSKVLNGRILKIHFSSYCSVSSKEKPSVLGIGYLGFIVFLRWL